MPILFEDKLIAPLENEIGVNLVVNFINKDYGIDNEIAIKSNRGEVIIAKEEFQIGIDRRTWSATESWERFYREYKNVKYEKEAIELDWLGFCMEFYILIKYPVASIHNAGIIIHINCGKILQSFKWPGKGSICVQMLVCKVDLDKFVEELNEQLLSLI